MKFPKLTKRDRMRLLGWAAYLGHIFIYDEAKRKAFIIMDGQVYYVQKEKGRIFGIHKNTREEVDLEASIKVSYFLHALNIFPIPEKEDKEYNSFSQTNLLKLLKYAKV